MLPMFRHMILFPLFGMLTESLMLAGEKVTIQFQSGDSITAELLAVRESVLIVSRGIGTPDEFLSTHPDEMLTIRRKDIQSFMIHGKSHLWDGVAIGLAGGICLGMLVSYEPTGAEAYKSNFDPQGGGPKMLVCCAVGGVALGVLAGGTGTLVTEDKYIDLNKKKNWISLRQYARYNETEPPFMK
ncbi:MAG: hypothetical protein ABSF91_10575 [Bacteroidota bacterium]|jgi:hypothetical protein